MSGSRRVPSRNKDRQAPRLARWILAHVVDRRERRFVIGDLDEEYRDIARAVGRGAARRWAWAQALRSIGPSLRRRLSRQAGGAPGRRRGAEESARGRGLNGREPSGPGASGKEVAVDALAQDLRCGIRNLARAPGFTAVAVLTLALGIGANTTVFSLMSPYLLRPLPFAEPERLVHLFETDPRLGAISGTQIRQSYPTYVDWRDQARSFAALGAYFYQGVNLSGGDDAPERVTMGRLSASVLPLLGVEPALGRWFDESEDRPGAGRVLVLSDGLWRRRLGTDPEVIGKALRVDGEQYVIVGVMPPEFNFPFGSMSMWAPIALDPATADRGRRSMLVIGRLAPDVTLEAAAAEVRALHGDLAAEYPDLYADLGVRVIPLREALIFFYDLVSTLMYLLLVVVGFVLLIVCANLANLGLSRAASRRREIAVRAALGAGRLRIMRQLLTENLILAVLAGGAGCLLALWATSALGPNIPADLFRVGEVGVDGAALAYAIVLAVGATVAIGMAPALRSARLDLVAALRDGVGASAGGARRRLVGALVVAQVGSAMVVCVGAASIIQGLLDIRDIDLGLNPDNVITVGMEPAPSDYPEEAQVRGFYQAVVDRVGAIAGIQSAALVDRLPLNFEEGDLEFTVPGFEPADPKERLAAAPLRVSRGYFGTMGIPLVSGRDFELADGQGSAAVAIVNTALARRYWPEGDAIGRTLVLHESDEGREVTVVGVVADSAGGIVFMGNREQIFFPHAQRPARRSFLVARTLAEPADVAPALRGRIWEVDPELPLGSLRTMNEVLRQSFGPLQLASIAVSAFGAFALALAALGIYGVVAYAVSLRTREIGIRLALGAGKRDVLALVMRQGGRLVLAGLVLGAIVSWSISAAIASQVETGDSSAIPTVVGVMLFLAAVAWLAGFLPARRATRVDPVSALRMD